MARKWYFWVKLSQEKKLNYQMRRIKKQISFDDRGIFGYLDEAPKGPISSQIMDKKEFVLVDVFDREYTCHLMTFIRLSTIIPETISYHAEGVSPEWAKEILKKRGIDVKKELAYYIFKKK